MLKKLFRISYLLFLFLPIEGYSQSPWIAKANFAGGARSYDIGFSIGHYGFLGCGNNGSNQNDFWRYDINTNTWTSVTSYPGQGQFGCSAFTIEGKGYVCFGASNAHVGTPDLWRYDTTTNAWTQMASCSGIGRYDVNWFVLGHKAYIIGGGYASSPYLNEVWVYDAHQNTWTQLANYPGGNLEGVIAFSIGNYGYAGNGYYDPNCNTTMYRYDTTSDTWSTIASIPVSYGFAGNPRNWVIGSKAYVFNGDQCTRPGPYDGWVYDTVTKSWCVFTSMAAPRLTRGYCAGMVINNRMFMGTGYDTSFHYLGDWWEYAPSTKINATDTTVCIGDSVHFSDSSSYLASSWFWSFPGGSPVTSTLQNPSVYYSSSGTYSTKLILTACGGLDTVLKSITVTLNPLPTVAISGGNNKCSGAPDTLIASGGTSYLWSTSATSSSIIVNPLITKTYSVTVSKAGCTHDTSFTVTVDPLPNVTLTANNPICQGDTSHITASGGSVYYWDNGATTSTIAVYPLSDSTYTVLVSNGNCTKDTSITITVNTPPVITLSGTTTICAGTSTNLIVSGGTSYTWSTTATTSSISVNPTSNTTYTIQVSNGTCTKDTTIKVLVNPLPIVLFSGSDTICKGASATLTASGGTTYIWSTSATTSAINVSPTSSTTYTVAVDNGTCTKDTSVHVIVNPLPIPLIAGNGILCIGKSTLLKATGGTSYLWEPALQTTDTITVSPNSPTTYTVTVTNSFGCKNDTTFKVQIVLPDGSVNGPNSLCPGNTVKLLASGGGTYLWNTGATTSSVSVHPSSNTTYSVVVNNGCIDTVTKTINMDGGLQLYACCDTTIAQPGIPVVLDASGTLTYSWLPSAGVSCNSCPDPIVSPTITTTYTVIGTDSAGCRVERFITVDVDICNTISIPNVFTPNGDGVNDEFVIEAQSVSAYSINIYDRWGKLMYQSTNPNVYWNGKDQKDNEFVPAGVYYYIIKYTCNGKSSTKDNYLQVIR